MEERSILFLSAVDEYIDLLPDADQAKLDLAIHALRAREYEEVHIKKLKGPIHELILRQHRFVFFEYQNCIYFVSAFRKKTMKTPKLEIEYAVAVYRKISK